MGISQSFLASRRGIVPGRQLVRVYERTARDGFLSPFEVPAEKRPVNTPTPDPEAGAIVPQAEFVFTAAELGGRVPQAGWVIQWGDTFWSIQSKGDRLLGQRIHVIAFQADDPRQG